MTETKVIYVAQVWIGTDPPCEPGKPITPEQLKQIKNIRKHVYLGQIQTKTATKRTKKNKEAK